ncbi:hypothetical protein [Ensifer aridi]
MTVSSLSPNQIRSLPSTAIAAWSADDVAGLTPAQVSALSSSQIAVPP